MLKRNDLAKQFELVVQQEIKNHNDQMLATNIAINELNKAGREVTNKIYEIKASVQSEQKDFEIKLCNISDCVELSESKIQRIFNDFKDFKEKIICKINQSLSLMTEFKVFNDILKNRISSLESKSKELDKEIDETRRHNLTNIEEVKRLLAKEIEKAKKEIISLPSEAQEVKKEIQKQMSIDRVDFEGLLKEIRRYKKENFIIDKKFEHIYTLIERLDKRIPK